MKKYYISSAKKDSSVARHAHDFYGQVLLDKGYLFLDSAKSFTDILSTVSSRDHAHIEIGISQKKEIELLFMMLNAKYRNVSITLHDSPFLKFPFYEFKNPLLNNLSKLYDRYIDNFGTAAKYVRQIRSIYVLSPKDIEKIKRKYRTDNVFHLSQVLKAQTAQPGGDGYKHFTSIHSDAYFMEPLEQQYKN